MKTILTLCAACLLAAGAHATTITFTFTSPTGDLGANETYTVNGYSIVATAEGSGSPHLWGKNDGGDENGLGLTSDPSGQHEITPGFFVQLDLSPAGLTGIQGDLLSISMGSTTSPDAWQIWNTNTANSLVGATSLKTGTDEAAFTITPTGRYLDIAATGGNVLLGPLTATVPEPISMTLVGGGLLALGFLKLRRRA